MTAPVVGRPVENVFYIDEPGAFEIALSGGSITYSCPCGCGGVRRLPIRLGEHTVGFWGWDGNRDKPTLTPSIKHLDACKFHGYLTGGTWTFCEDSGNSQCD